jgi:hypothetical protein
VSDLEIQAVVRFKFLNTPGTEIAPRSNVVGKNFESQRLSHDVLLSFHESRASILKTLVAPAKSGLILPQKLPDGSVNEIRMAGEIGMLRVR